MKQFLLHVTAIFVLALLIGPSLVEAAPPRTIVVVGDESYAPFEFLDQEGQPRGIFVDQWRLWSQKTGITVDYRLMKWADALAQVLDGRAEAVGGIFQNTEREKSFDFSLPHQEIQTHIFFHRSIYALKSLADLKGFRVGVVQEDFAEEFIKSHQPKATVVTYSSNEELVRAAVQGQLRVFVADTPVALFHLAKTDQSSEFKHSTAALYTNRVYSAVKKGRSDLLTIINNGFRAMTSAEINQIERRWTGVSPWSQVPWRWLILVLVLLLFGVGLVTLLNAQLRRRVQTATKGLENKQAELNRELAEHREAEQALRASEEQYRELFNSITDFIFTHDLEGRFLSVNRATAERFGVSPEEMIGRLISDFLTLSHQATFKQDYLDKIRDQGHLTGLMIARHQSGQQIYIEFRNTLVNRNDRRPYISGSGRDVTERFKAQQEIRKIQEQLHQAQKMEAVGNLASGIAHDFNNILQALAGYIQLLQTKDDPVPLLNRYLGEMDLVLSRAADLVHRLLTFSRKVQPELKALDLNQVIRQAITILERIIPKMIRIETHLAGDLQPINGDVGQIEQVLMNLGTNARDAMPAGGRLVVSTENVNLETEFCSVYPDMRPGPCVRLTVSDIGVGMDEETRRHMFEPFFTTKGVGQGTGLGLSTVYGIIKGHGGLALCHSHPEAGTTFDIYFPALTEKPLLQPAGKPQSEETLGGGETILLVDDEKAILEVAEELLADLGYRTMTATSGEEALELYRDHQREIELIILDLGMPGMGGLSCLRELKRLNAGVKVIIASGYATHGRHDLVIDSGAKGFLAKPYRLLSLAQTVRSALDQN